MKKFIVAGVLASILLVIITAPALAESSASILWSDLKATNWSPTHSDADKVNTILTDKNWIIDQREGEGTSSLAESWDFTGLTQGNISDLFTFRPRV